MKRPSRRLKNLTIRLSVEQLKHIKRRAIDERHYKLSEVVRRMVDSDMVRVTN